MICFLVILAVVIVAAFLIPIKVVIYIKLKGDNVYYVDNTKKNNDVTIVIKILGFIPVYKYVNKKKENNENNSESLNIMDIIDVLRKSITEKELKINTLTKKLFRWGEKIKFRKLILIGGFNTEDYVKNAYINASINSIICMFINANQDNFNLNKLYYQVSISNYKYYLTLDTVLTFPVINNMDVLKTIISIVHKFKKKKHEKEQENNNIQSTNRQSNNYIKMQQKYDIT